MPARRKCRSTLARKARASLLVPVNFSGRGTLGDSYFSSPDGDLGLTKAAPIAAEVLGSDILVVSGRGGSSVCGGSGSIDRGLFCGFGVEGVRVIGVAPLVPTGLDERCPVIGGTGLDRSGCFCSDRLIPGRRKVGR